MITPSDFTNFQFSHNETPTEHIFLTKNGYVCNHYSFPLYTSEAIPEVLQQGWNPIFVSRLVRPDVENPIGAASGLYSKIRGDEVMLLRIHFNDPIDEEASFVSLAMSTTIEDEVIELQRVCHPHLLKDESELEIYVMQQGRADLYLQSVPLKPITLDLSLHYGSSFPEKYEKMMACLNKDESGLYLLHGVAGSGKTSLIKYIAQNTKRRCIFVPTNQIEMLTSPSLLKVLLDAPNSVLIIEDAEKAVEAREGNFNSSLVSTILNLTDGIIGSMLQVSVIATFNTGKENIDSALLRKGRLKFEHEFKKLSVEDAKRMAEHLGKTIEVKEDMSLADIFNCDEENYRKEEESKRRVGFG